MTKHQRPHAPEVGEPPRITFSGHTHEVYNITSYMIPEYDQGLPMLTLENLTQWFAYPVVVELIGSREVQSANPELIRRLGFTPVSVLEFKFPPSLLNRYPKR